MTWSNAEIEIAGAGEASATLDWMLAVLYLALPWFWLRQRSVRTEWQPASFRPLGLLISLLCATAYVFAACGTREWARTAELTGKIGSAVLAAFLVVVFFRIQRTGLAAEAPAPGLQQDAAEAEVRRLNESLQQRVTELQTLLDLLPVGIGIAQDPDGREITTNRAFAQLLKLPPQANASLSAPPWNAPSTFKVMKDGRELRTQELPMQLAVKGNTDVLDFECTVVRSDGRELQLLVNAVPLRDSAGQVRGAVGTFQDITLQKAVAAERLAFERRLQETQKLDSLGVLAGGIAHDFNNLLTGILGNASLARLETPPGYPAAINALDNVEQAALRAGDLCKQMLAYAGKGRFVVQSLNLSAIVQEMAELLAVSLGRRAHLQLELDVNLPEFQGDSTQVRQVLMNLVINSAEAMGDRSRGTVTIRTGTINASSDYLAAMSFRETAVEGRYVFMEVVDHGCGMDAAMVARIFDPFYTTKFTGRGLGLAAVLGIVRGHKGAIKVYSELGRGTDIRILFPALQADVVPEPSKRDSRSPLERDFGRVLVVDDEEAVRSVAAKILRGAGCDVITAKDGTEAVEIFRRRDGPFVAILLDLTMPHMDGEAAFHALRAIDPKANVILMSGFNEQDAVDRFAGRGVAGFVPKPFTADMLLSKLSEVVARRTSE